MRPGTITFLSDTTYPPQESIDPATQKAVGFDIEIAQAIANKMGLSATIQTTDSTQLVGALLAKKGDAIISALQITPDLERQVALVAYFQAGQSILVRKGNPSSISSVSDLCGKKVSVQVQSPEETTIDQANAGICKDNPIKKQIYPVDLQAVAILKQGGVEAALDDSPVAAYFVKQTPDQLEQPIAAHLLEASEAPVKPVCAGERAVNRQCGNPKACEPVGCFAGRSQRADRHLPVDRRHVGEGCQREPERDRNTIEAVDRDGFLPALHLADELAAQP